MRYTLTDKDYNVLNGQIMEAVENGCKPCLYLILENGWEVYVDIDLDVSRSYMPSGDRDIPGSTYVSYSAYLNDVAGQDEEGCEVMVEYEASRFDLKGAFEY